MYVLPCSFFRVARLGLLLLIFCLPLFLSAPAGSTEEKEEEEIPIDISADNLKGRAGTEGDFLVLEGNVRIVHGSTVATGATGIYFRNSRKATLGGGVEIVDGETFMSAERASYSLETEVASLQEKVLIRNNDLVLTGSSAEFRRKENVAVLTGNVTMIDSTSQIQADRIVYDRDSEMVKAQGKVVAFDSEHEATVTGGHAIYNRDSKVAVITSAPELVSTESDGAATVVVGEQMEFSMEENILRVRGTVQIERKDLKASCQLAEFYQDENRAVLSGQPRAWDESGEIVGDSLELHSDGEEIRTVLVFGGAEVLYTAPEGEAPETSLVRGDSVRIMLDDEEVKEVFVFGNARSEYSSLKEGKPSRNVAEGETIYLEVEDGRPSKATFEGRTSGVYNFFTASGDSLIEEEVDYSSKKIEFVIDDNLIRLTDNAELNYRNLKLAAEEVEFNADAQTLEAAGDPTLWENQEKVTGNRMTYSLESARGTIYQGKTRFQKGFYTGTQIRKVGEKTLNVRGGEYTTCELEKSHYHFRSSRMKIYMNDKVIAKPLILYVRQVPVLALPFYVFPIKPGRHSGFLIPNIEFGFNSTRGRFIRNAGYYWAMNEYADVTAWMDYFENDPRWIAYFEGRYNLRYTLSGWLRSSYSKNAALGRTQWDLRGSHRQTLGEGLDLSMAGDFVSDKSYRLETWGLGGNYEESVNRILRSKMSLTKRWSSAQLTLAYDRTAYMDTDPDNGIDELRRWEMRPTASFTLQSKAIGRAAKGKNDEGWLPWLRTTYLSASSALLSEIKTYESREEKHTGMSTRLGLRDSRKLWGTLSISPGLTYTENWYDKDLLGNRYQRSGIWSSSVGAGATLYRVFMLGVGPLRGIRHSVSPRLNFSYQPDFPQYSYVDEFGRRTSRFPRFGSISTSWSERQSLSMSLYNRFQAKLRWKDKVIKLDDLLDVNVSTSYDFLYREHSKSQPFSSINTSVRLKPIHNLSSELFLSHEPVKGEMTSMSLVSYVSLQGGATRRRDETSAGDEEGEETAEGDKNDASGRAVEEDSHSGLPWSGALTFRYSRGADPSSASYWLDGSTSFHLSKNWRVQYSAHYDLKEKQVVSQTFALFRDLHCWEAVFMRRFSGNRWEYYFKINIKAHKEIYLERGTALR
jgi:lipopolysaccharide assembly outer membrane protein LptD (OstA)